MYLAAKSNSNEDVVKALVEGGAPQLLVPDKAGCIPMHLASHSNSADTMQVLLEAGGPEQLWLKSAKGLAPIHCAAATCPLT